MPLSRSVDIGTDNRMPATSLERYNADKWDCKCFLTYIMWLPVSVKQGAYFNGCRGNILYFFVKLQEKSLK